MENFPTDIIENILFRLSIEVALRAKRVCTTWEAILGSKFTNNDYAMAELKFDARLYGIKKSELLQTEGGQDFFTGEVFESSDAMGHLQDLAMRILSYGLMNPSAVQQSGFFPFCKGLLLSNELTLRIGIVMQEYYTRRLHPLGFEMPSSTVQQRKTVLFCKEVNELLGLLTRKKKSSIAKNEVIHSTQCRKHIFRDMNRRFNKRKDVWKRKL